MLFGSIVWCLFVLWDTYAFIIIVSVTIVSRMYRSQVEKQDQSESCINNVKLTLNCTKDYEKSPHRNHKHHRVDSSIYTKQTKDKRKSNEKYYRASLENVSTDVWKDGFDEQSSLRRTRSLAISRENLFYSLDYVSTEVQGQGRRRRRSQLIPRARLIDKNKDYRYSVENLYSPPRRSRRPSDLSPPDYTPPEETYIEHYHQQHQTVDETYSFPKKLKKTDSLDSNSNNKSSKNGIQASYEELSLPNYYPEARYDTDNTDIVSLTDNISSLSLDNLSKFKYSSFDNLDIKWDRIDQSDSIPYDENIVLSPNKSLYEEIKPKTIRNPTDYREDTYSKPSSEPSVEIKEIEETDTNHDEINLNNDSVEKEETCDDTSTVVEVSSDKTDTIKTIKADEDAEQQKVIAEDKDNTIKAYIGGPATPQDDETYKTVVSVDVSPEKQEDEIPHKCKHVNRKDPKSHSHNYLKEFLETQKGSKKPLQNFIAKKFSHLSRRQSKEGGNLIENQFHSLPDISISKNLRKCEKIDRKLRKCEKSEHLKHKEAFGENRFIVNIGRHFDITANSSIPLDFELKIAKIPKKAKKSNTKTKDDQEFLNAIKNLKATLQNSSVNFDENHNITKDMNILKSNDKDTKEFKDRLGSMRSYWCKMTGSSASHTEGETCNEDDKKNDICKIVEVQTKVDEVKKKFEQKQEQPEEKPPSKVQLTKQLFEPKPEKEKVEKISPVIKETCNYFENNAHLFDTEKPYESLCPANVEIVEAKPNGVCSKPKEKKDETDNKKCKVTKSKSIDQPEFDHVRYKIVKSDLFQKKIFANCEKESQFDGLIEYLQNYSFQELLIDNNIVIIEPIRSKVPYEPSECVKSMRNVTPMLHKSKSETQESEKSTLNKHFFYRPIRVNKEVNDDELPNPDTVRQVREFFEGGVKKSRSNQDILANNKEKQSENTSDPDKDRCSATDTNSHSSNISDFDGHENLYDSIDNEIYCEYVSEDILEKIRERGSTVTYYGGRVVKQNSSQPLLTKTIMEEIQNNEKRCNECNNCIRNSCDENQESFIGMKFRILKSNSCSSRLELVGTESLQESRRKMMTQHRKTMNQGNLRRKSNVINEDANNEHASNMDDKNAINEHIKKQNQNQPKIIGEEMKLQENKITQWKEIKKDGSCNNVNFNEKRTQKIYDYYHYDKMKSKSKKIDDMEFEPYEVAG